MEKTNFSTLPWWRKPVRMMRRDYVSDFRPFIQANLDSLARKAREHWQVNCEWVMATPGCAPGTAHLTLFNTPRFEKMPGIGAHDLLREYLPHVRRHGIHLLAYVNMHWYSYEFADTHPDWEQLLEDGTAYGHKHPLYGGGTTLCVNSPWRDWAFEMIREVMRTGVDGCFLDGPVVYPGACYCKYCRRLFKIAAQSSRLPKFGDWNHPLWKRFADFRAGSWARFMCDAQAAAREIHPGAVMFLNGGGFSSHNLSCAYDAARMESCQTFTGSEQFFHCADGYDSPYKTLNLARFLSAGKNPGVVFTHHGLSTWHYAPLPPAEMSTALAQTVAGGSNTWFAVFHEAIKKDAREALAPLETTGGFIADCDPYVTGDRSAAETAVLISNRTLYYYLTRHHGLCRDVGSGREAGLVVEQGGTQQKGDLRQRREVSAEILDHENQGCLDVCNFAHVPARILWDDHLISEKLRGVKVLLLPNAACLAQKQLAAIERFVRNGGGLVAAFEAGMYDEWGDPMSRQNWLRFLGIERIKGVFVPSRTEDYLTLTTPLDNIPADSLIPRPVHGLAVRAADDAKALAYYLNPINKAYTQPKGVSDYPAILATRRGKGCVVYLASPLFDAFDRFHIDAHKDLARALIRLAAGRIGLQVETDAPGSLAIEVREQKGRTLVHLVNVTSDMKRPMGQIVPLYDVPIAMRSKATRAKCLRSGQPLRLKRKGNRVCFRVPKIRDYEIVVLSGT
ncbi:MAG: hypothetical protein HY360_07100 [Verrucomicrobia bacterium]|nr:hypothetical protein [Verrucomicrobiota bacterium]